MTHSALQPAAISLSVLLAASCAVNAQHPTLDVEHPPCSEAENYDPAQETDGALRKEIALLACRLPTDDLDAAEIERRLAGERFSFDVSGNELTLLSWQDAQLQQDCARSRGAINACLEQKEGSAYWAARFRLAYANEAMLTFFVSDESVVRVLRWRGVDAPPDPILKTDLAGEVIETDLWSESLGETRRLVVYLPEGHDANMTYPAVFLADGSVVSDYARFLEPLIDEGRLPRLVLVGSVSGQRGIVEDRSELNTDLRAADYLPGFYRDRFNRHMSFFADELTGYAVEAWGVSGDPAMRAVHGRSNGGRFAMYAGYLRPDQFKNAIATSNSAAGFGEASPAAENSASFFLVSGRYEPTVIYGSRRAAAILRAAGYEVMHHDLSVGHTPEVDEVMLLPLLEQIFPEEPGL